MELLDPLAVEDVGLAPGHSLQLSGIDEPHLEAARTEELEEGDPVHAGGLHRHGLDATPGQPVGQGVEIRGERPERTDVAPFEVAALRDRDIVAFGAEGRHPDHAPLALLPGGIPRSPSWYSR
jgi:hypothetical protein